MPVLRQITTCTEAAAHVVEARTRAGGDLRYRLEVCARHRWLAQEWPGKRSTRTPEGRCGTVLDGRPYTAVVQSHVDMWLRPLTTQNLAQHGGDTAVLLRAAHGWLASAYSAITSPRDDREHGIAAVLDHAARLAEALAEGRIDDGTGRAQLLAVLSVAETLSVLSRGA